MPMHRAAPLRVRLATELAAGAAFATLYLTLFSARPRYVDLLVGGAAVGAIAFTAAGTRRLWAALDAEAGASPERAPAAWRIPLAFTAAAVLSLAVAGAMLGALGIGPTAGARFTNWHLLPAILLYFPWAWLQQFVFQFYLLPRLLLLLPAGAAMAATALAFAAVHYPRYPIMALTAVAGAVWTLSYRRHRRLAPLAASHALLGPVLHYWVLGRDLLAGWLA